MNLDKLRSMLKEAEGTVLVPGHVNRHALYKCPAGKWTIGWGHNLEDNGVPETIAIALLECDLAQAISDLRRSQFVSNSTWELLGDVRQNVLIEMCFNLGISRLRGFKKMAAALAAGDFVAAAIEMMNSAWYKQTGERAFRLVLMMETGEWPSEGDQ